MALKKYKATTPSRRQMTGYSFEEITVRDPEKSLIARLQKHGGRNNTGRITCRHRGGGTTRFYRQIDFKQLDKHDIPGIVKTVEYDPNRSAYIMLVQYADGEKRYHLAPLGIAVGLKIVTSDRTKIKLGNRLMLRHVPVGYDIYNVELMRGRGGQAVRTAGTSAQVVAIEGDFAQVQFPSKEIRLIHKDCFATLGRVSNEDHGIINLGNAGRKRRMGWRPEVRGKVMNPCDHPHGGGEGRNSIGLKYPKTPWGLHALGVKTRARKKASNKYIMKTRRGGIYKS